MDAIMMVDLVAMAAGAPSPIPNPPNPKRKKKIRDPKKAQRL
jgi:hypothetical protein